MCSGQCYGVKRVKARTTRTEILCFLFGSDMVAGSWLGGCLLWPIDMKMRYMWRDCEGTVFD